jgi:glutathione peroxidase-family protein
VEWAEVLQDTDLVTKRSLFEFTAIDIDGQEVPLSRFAGQVCLVVNVACE